MKILQKVLGGGLLFLLTL